MLVSARQIFLGAKAKAKNPYITNGLAAMWDGINNVGFDVPHDGSATTWVNVGSSDRTLDTPCQGRISWVSDGAVFTKQDGVKRFLVVPHSGFMRDYMGGEWTIEAVITPYSGFMSNYPGVAGNHINTSTQNRGLVFYQYVAWPSNTACIGNGVFANGDPDYGVSLDLPTSNVIINRVQSCTLSASVVNGVAKFYKDGSQIAQTSYDSNRTLTYSGDFLIGAAFDDSLRTFVGVIHSLRVYSRQLTDAEVTQNLQTDQARFNLP